MPRYHFNVFDGVDLPDTYGVELPDVASARREAIRFAGSIMEDGGTRESLGQKWHMEVTDGDGQVKFRLDFVVTDTPMERS